MSVDIHVVTLADCDLSDPCHRPILSVISWFEAVFRESQVNPRCARPDCWTGAMSISKGGGGASAHSNNSSQGLDQRRLSKGAGEYPSIVSLPPRGLHLSLRRAVATP